MNADLTEGDYSDMTFTNVYFQHARFCGSNLHNTKFIRCQMTRVRMDDCASNDAELNECELTRFEPLFTMFRRLRWVQHQHESQVNGKMLCRMIEHWPVIMANDAMMIGCETHSYKNWEAFPERNIAAMGGRPAIRFYRNWVQDLCDEADRGYGWRKRQLPEVANG
jgi:hypothetical protein